MFKAIIKWWFKRKYLSILREEIWKATINADYLETVIESREEQIAKKETELAFVESEIERLKDSHERADRDNVKKLTAEAKTLRKVLEEFDGYADGTRGQVKEHRDNIVRYNHKTDWVKKNF